MSKNKNVQNKMSKGQNVKKKCPKDKMSKKNSTFYSVNFVYNEANERQNPEQTKYGKFIIDYFKIYLKKYLKAFGICENGYLIAKFFLNIF